MTGRADETFKWRGVRLSCQEVEAAAATIADVRGAVLVPPADDRRLVLFLAGELSPQQALRQLRGLLGEQRCPTECRVVRSIPATPNGKPNWSALTALLTGSQ